MIIKNRQYNIGHICTRQQCEQGLGKKRAFRWVSVAGGRKDCDFFTLDRESNRVANALKSLGFVSGDVLFTFLPKIPQLFFCFLGALKLQVVCGALYPGCGDETIADRLRDANAKGLITQKNMLKKIIRVRHRLPQLRHIIATDDEPLSNGILNYSQLVHRASDDFNVSLTTPETPSTLHYTSGSAGKPKGVLHVHQSVIHQSQTAREVLGLKEKDVFWCTADPGWITGTSYGIIGPWALGVSQIHYGGGYDAARWLDLLEKEEVTVWYTSPTALRMLMREDPKLFRERDLKKLRCIFSVGEPLNPEVIHWARANLGKDVYDTWFQTETGGIMIANRPGLPLKPGSMGMPVDGVEAGILAEDGTSIRNGHEGILCLREGWPSMFVNYINQASLYKGKFHRGHYFSGDIAARDNDGYYWFKGRSDDVINTAGHLISPFEIESALLEIEEIAEAAAVGAPDDLLYEKMIVFICLHKRFSWSKDLELKIRLFLSNKVSSLATPQEIVPVKDIPKNKNGKIMRRVLKAHYLGQGAGDLSVMED